MTPERVQRAVHEVLGVTPELQRGPVRRKPVAFARHVAMTISYRLPSRPSLHEVSRAFGRTDHTTVMFALRKIDKAAKLDAAVADVLERVRAIVCPGLAEPLPQVEVGEMSVWYERDNAPAPKLPRTVAEMRAAAFAAAYARAKGKAA